MNIRIIPMSLNDDEFEGKDIEYVQKEYFKGTLDKTNKGWYYYGKNGLEAQSGDLLLFQMENSIIASAELEDVICFKKTSIDGNNGALILNRKTIKIFKPITKEELKKYIPDFIAFNQVKQKYDSKEVNIELLKERMKNND